MRITKRRPSTAQKDCLDDIWSSQPVRDEVFDRDHDFVQGQSISCATGTTAGRFAAAITDIREAANGGDADGVLLQFDSRVLYIDDAGKRLTLADDASRTSNRDVMLDAQMLTLLSELDLSNMQIVPGQGVFFEVGTVWLASRQRGGYPKIVTINRQAMREAAQSRP